MGGANFVCRTREAALETLTAMNDGNNKIIINLIVMAIGFALFGLVLYGTMMVYEWLNICTSITDCYNLGYID